MNQNNENVLFYSILRYMLTLISIILMPVILFIFLIFATHRLLVTLILRIKLKSRFGGLLKGSDVFWTLDGASKAVINIVMIVQSDGNADEFYKRVKRILNDHFFHNTDRFPNALSVRKKAIGYYYLLKNDVTINDCIYPLKLSPDAKDSTTKDDLLKMLCAISNEALPKKHTGFAEVLIGTQPIKWRENVMENNLVTYPVVFRIHRSVGDIAVLLKLMLETFTNTSLVFANYQDLWNYIEEKKHSERKYPDFGKEILGKIVERFKNGAKLFSTLFSFPLVIFNYTWRTPDENVLHGPSLTGEKILVMKIEESRYFINAIKRIKEKIPGADFTDVLLTAVSESFRKFFQKNMVNVPEFITMDVTEFPGSPKKLAKIKLEDCWGGKHSMMATMVLPINHTGKESFVGMTEKIKNQRNSMKNLNIRQINWSFLTMIFTILPDSLLWYILNKSTYSSWILSNVSGGIFLNIFGGYPLQDLVFWLPHQGNTGLALSAFSYDTRLQLTLSVDKSLMSSEIDAQSILDEVYNNVSIMDNEIKKWTN